jgi:hypothetical protein
LTDPTSLAVLLDQELPRDAAAQLRILGVDYTHVGEIGMAIAADTEILEWACHQGMELATGCLITVKRHKTTCHLFAEVRQDS